jgi:hypothetical protein
METGADRGSKLVFLTAPLCKDLASESGSSLAIQDLAIHKCGEKSGCEALVLPKRHRHLVSCPLSSIGAEGEDIDVTSDVAAGLSLFQRQAVYRKISANDTIPNVEFVRSHVTPNKKYGLKDQLSDQIAAGFLENTTVPLASAWLDEFVGEEPSALSILSCPDLEGRVTECPVIATSAGRVVQMTPGRAGDTGEASWVPRRMIAEDDGKKFATAGALASLSGNHLGALHTASDNLQILHSASGTDAVSKPLRLPKASNERPWAAVCAGGGSVFALESGEDPAIWRFTPK